jgi:glycosyltransferase involved in cell wall biosynthesis
MSPDLRWADKLEQFSILHATKLTSPSQHLVDELRHNGWIPHSQVEVIPYPLEWRNWCQVSPVATTDPVIAYIGRFEPLKRPEVLVAAAKLLAREMPDIRIVFVGRNNAWRGNISYLDWIKEQAADPFYEFIDEVPRSALPEILSRIRIAVAPSIFESFHLGTAEAMASGRPVIVTKGVGISEIVDGHNVGQVVAPDDPIALADALRPFLASASYASEFGARASSLIRSICDPERIAERRERLYTNAIAEHWRKDQHLMPNRYESGINSGTRRTQ